MSKLELLIDLFQTCVHFVSRLTAWAIVSDNFRVHLITNVERKEQIYLQIAIQIECSQSQTADEICRAERVSKRRLEQIDRFTH